MKKTMRFLEIGCNCGCSRVIPKKTFAELREAFQALSRSEQDIFLMAQLKAMNGGEITASRRLKKKTRTNKKLFIIEIAIRPSVKNVSQYVRNWSHLLRKRQKSPSNEWYNTTRSW